MKRALVLAGGGSRGAYEIGAWKALNELGVRFQAVYGTSIGAINAALFAQGDFETAQRVWSEIRIDQIVRTDDTDLSLDELIPNKRDLVGFLRENRKFINMDITPLEELLQRCLSEARIRAAGLELGFMAVRIPQMQAAPIRLSDMREGTLRDWVIASASCFPVFPVRRIASDRYVDGGFVDNLPVDMALADGCDEIVAVDPHPNPAHPEYHGMPFLRLVYPLHSLGGFLDFDPGLLRRSRLLGYNDTMKAFGRMEGIKYTFVTEDPMDHADAAHRYALAAARFDAEAIRRGALASSQLQNAPLIRALTGETPLRRLSWNDVWLRGLELMAEVLGFREDAIYRADQLIGRGRRLAEGSEPSPDVSPATLAKRQAEGRRSLFTCIWQWLNANGGCPEASVPALAKYPAETAAALFLYCAAGA